MGSWLFSGEGLPDDRAWPGQDWCDGSDLNTDAHMYFLFHQQSPINMFHLNYTLGQWVRSVCHVLLLLLNPSLSEQTDKRLQGAAVVPSCCTVWYSNFAFLHSLFPVLRSHYGSSLDNFWIKLPYCDASRNECTDPTPGSKENRSPHVIRTHF